MMKYQSITILFVLLFLFRIAQSQCIETGYVKEYNGVEEKTPLPGVELQVVGSPSARTFRTSFCRVKARTGRKVQ